MPDPLRKKVSSRASEKKKNPSFTVRFIIEYCPPIGQRQDLSLLPRIPTDDGQCNYVDWHERLKHSADCTQMAPGGGRGSSHARCLPKSLVVTGFAHCLTLLGFHAADDQGWEEGQSFSHKGHLAPLKLLRRKDPSARYWIVWSHP